MTEQATAAPPAAAAASGDSRSSSTMRVREKQTPINLHRGWPSTSLLPVDALKGAAQAALSAESIRTPASALLYAPDPGFQELREALAGWLGRFYNEPHSDDRAVAAAAAPTGPSTTTMGTKTARAAVAAAAVVDQITITGGASQSLANILASFTDPSYTRAVWMVAPAYFLACPIMADAGFGGRMRAVPEGDEGIDLGFLSAELEKLDREGRQSESGRPAYKDPAPFRKIYRHVIYCVPTFANPSGKTMSLRRRRGLVELAREHDALVVCDDVYDMLQWSTSPSATDAAGENGEVDLNRALLPRLVDIDLALGPSQHDLSAAAAPSSSSSPSTTTNATGGTTSSPRTREQQHFGHAISNGSFSKLAGPGLRTGWTQSTADFALGLSQTGATRSGGAPSQMTASIVCELLRSGELQREIEEVLRPAFRRRHGMMMGAVEEYLTQPFGVSVGEGGLDGGGGGVFGGYFIWLNLPVGNEEKPFPGARAIAERCKRDEELIIGYGGMFEVQGDEDAVKLDHAIRLCFAWEEENHLVQGVERLGKVVGGMLDEGPSSWQVAGGSGRGGGGADEQK
ncbi:kynurenine/2-aminoadipate aminotransferase [Microdochium nivale]|nr:kynurenine/2-aminoadipate aminotransferase [Microdochium nivale]